MARRNNGVLGVIEGHLWGVIEGHLWGDIVAPPCKWMLFFFDFSKLRRTFFRKLLGQFLIRDMFWNQLFMLIYFVPSLRPNSKFWFCVFRLLDFFYFFLFFNTLAWSWLPVEPYSSPTYKCGNAEPRITRSAVRYALIASIWSKTNVIFLDGNYS